MPTTKKEIPVNLERVDCLVCGGQESNVAVVARDRLGVGSNESFNIVECSNCGFRFLNPRPRESAIVEYYADESYQPFLSAQASRNLIDKVYAWVREYALASKRRKIERLKAPGRLLDVGCGTGEFLYEMQSHGWQASGIEKDAQAARFAREIYSLDVTTRDIEAKKHLKKSYDIVTLWHVLEHLHQPAETLRTIREILKDDGYVLIAVPNIGSVDAGFYGQHWVALDAPRHLYHFSPAKLAVFLKRFGFTVTKIVQMPLDAFYNCLMSELIYVNQTGRKLFLPGYLLRAKLLALLSIARSTRFRIPERRQGSSVLYYVKKCEISNDVANELERDNGPN